MPNASRYIMGWYGRSAGLPIAPRRRPAPDADGGDVRSDVMPENAHTCAGGPPRAVSTPRTAAVAAPSSGAGGFGGWMGGRSPPTAWLRHKACPDTARGGYRHALVCPVVGWQGRGSQVDPVPRGGRQRNRPLACACMSAWCGSRFEWSLGLAMAISRTRTARQQHAPATSERPQVARPNKNTSSVAHGARFTHG